MKSAKALLLLTALCACSAGEAGTTTLTKAELGDLYVGHTVRLSGRTMADYMQDGTWRANNGAFGTYTITDHGLCYVNNRAQSGCNRHVQNGSGVFTIAKDGVLYRVDQLR